MSIQKRLLGWDRPFLEAAVEAILEPYRSQDSWDMTRTLIVSPSKRAVAHLREGLAIAADSAGVIWTPPTVTSVGGLDFQVLPSSRPIASAMESRQAWYLALKRLESSWLEKLIRRPMDAGDEGTWRLIAQALMQLRSTLGASRLTMAKVAEDDSSFVSPQQKERWQSLAQAEGHYLAILQEADRTDVTAWREEALERDQARWNGQIVLIGTVDLNEAQAALLEQCAVHGSSITSVVYAPEKLAGKFDPFGRLDSSYWLKAPIDLKDEQMIQATGPRDQARAAIAEMNRWCESVASDQMAVAIIDDEVGLRLELEGGCLGVPLWRAEGTHGDKSPPIMLLNSLMEYCSSKSASDLAQLMRHPDMGAWLARRAGTTPSELIAAFDDYVLEFLPASIDYAAPPDDRMKEPLQAALARLGELIKPLASSSAPLSAWAERIASFFSTVYAENVLDPDDPLDQVLEASIGPVVRALEQMSTFSVTLGEEVALSDAASQLLGELHEDLWTIPQALGSVPLLGWLDVWLEPVSAVVVTGMNEERLGPGGDKDPFLPADLRRAVGLPGPERRLARDRYILSTLLGSKRPLTITFGQFGANGDPLIPSRLLLADEEKRPKRVQTFFDSNSRSWRLADREPGGTRVDVPTLEAAQGINQLSVTAFRDYLASPYRFYLRHVMRLKYVCDDEEELDSLKFGSLIHQVLCTFGTSPLKDSGDEQLICDFLMNELRKSAEAAYRKTNPAIEVQIEQIEARLESWAKWQAQWAREGWRIAAVEAGPLNDYAEWMVDGTPFRLRGRIDRIDWNPRTQEVAILDYKTGSRAMTPKEVHQHKGEWLDLQLPLYRHLLSGISLPDWPPLTADRLKLGYVSISRELDKICECFADWSEEDLEEADEVARGVIRGIRRGEFAYAPSTSADYFPEFSRICQDGQEMEL